MKDAVEVEKVRRAAEATHRRAGGDRELLRAFVAMVQKDDAVPAKWRAGVWYLVADSLAAVRLERVAAARRLADIGSGTGFPGLVLATALPHTSVTLIEHRPGRHRFLSRTVRALGLDNDEVVVVSAQAWDAGRGLCDVVTSRNVGPTNSLVELAAPLLRLGGAAVLWTQRRLSVEAETNAAADAVGLRCEEAREEGRKRVLYVYAKVARTPRALPRPGAAAMRDPLGVDTDPADWEPDGGTVRLTPVQQQVLELLADESRDVEIAAALKLPPRSARQEIRRIRRKLAAKTLDEAVARARGCGLLPASGPRSVRTAPGGQPHQRSPDPARAAIRPSGRSRPQARRVPPSPADDAPSRPTATAAARRRRSSVDARARTRPKGYRTLTR
jgi:16S rRNA (guanine527-N7)-methyltransferase